MNRTIKIQLYAFVAAIMILLIPTTAIYLWYELSPQSKLIFSSLGAKVKLVNVDKKHIGILKKAEYRINYCIGFIDLMVEINNGVEYRTFLRPWELDKISVVTDQDKQTKDTDSTSALKTPAAKPSQVTISTPQAVQLNDIQRQPPKAEGSPVLPNGEPVGAQPQLKSKALISAENLGKLITVEGLPVNYRIEAALSSREGNIVWMKGLSQWPKEVVAVRGKYVRVTGVLSEDYGGGAFILDGRDGKQQKHQGHPVSPGADLKKINHRFVIINAKWEVIDK